VQLAPHKQNRMRRLGDGHSNLYMSTADHWRCDQPPLVECMGRTLVFVVIGMVALLAALYTACQSATSNLNIQSTPAEERSAALLPRPSEFLNDYVGIIDEATKKQVESTLVQLKERSMIEFAVVIIDTTENLPIKDYSLALARDWGLGSEDETRGGGLLLLIAAKDKRWWMQVSRGLERDLPNDAVRNLGKLIEENFSQQRFDAGLSKFVGAVIAKLAKERGFVVDELRVRRIGRFARMKSYSWGSVQRSRD